MSLIGIPIGFYGYLFPGNINLMVLELYTTKRYQLLSFMLGLIVLFESIYCVGSLVFLYTVKTNSSLYLYVDYASSALVLIMGLWMLLEKKAQKATHHHTIFRGVFSIIIHPQQIPFWIIAGVFISRYIDLNNHASPFIFFVVFNAIGTLLVMIFYMLLGKKILNYFRVNMAHVNKIMGAVYIFLAVYHQFS